MDLEETTLYEMTQIQKDKYNVWRLDIKHCKITTYMPQSQRN